MTATQLERVIAASRSFQGTCQSDWLASETPDGSRRITPVAARINEARELGYEFEILHDRGGTRVYRLVSEPVDVDRSDGDRPAPGVSPSAVAPVNTDEHRLFKVGKPEMPHWKAA